MGWKGALLEMPLWAVSQFRPSGFDPVRQAPREILVLRPNDFGDLLTTTPVFEALRRRFPTTRLIAGIGGWGRAVVENNPFVDEIIQIDAPWNNKVVRNQSLTDGLRYIWGATQVAALRKRNGFDVGIDVLGSHMGLMLMLRAGVRYRVGVRGYRGGWSACQAHIPFKLDVHVARAALRQAELLGATDLPEARPQLYLTDAERAQATELWQGTPRPSRKPLRLLVGCAAGLPDKTWSAQALGTALRELALTLAGKQEDLEILIVGSAADEPRATQIAAASGIARVRSVVGQTSLRSTFALAEQADAVLTNSSMLLHVAAAFHRPTVAVLGGSLADTQAHDALWGYPPPYRSVGPTMPVAGTGAASWPTVHQVVEAVLNALELRISESGARDWPQRDAAHAVKSPSAPLALFGSPQT
ncbi:MAG: glycosyltransferase family 9 protein [Paraburkholderia sp.]|uniref:glycosyltransferase family 9 protein n=1 Tax=Paraburkholderia sp. TaxID=1926495 RepID=UPI003C349D88